MNAQMIVGGGNNTYSNNPKDSKPDLNIDSNKIEM